MKHKRIAAALLSAMICTSSFAVPHSSPLAKGKMSASAAGINDMPSDYQYAADWIWTNRIEREQSTVRRNTIFDQIIAGKGTINYVVKWQSYQTVTYEQRRQFEEMLSKSIL